MYSSCDIKWWHDEKIILHNELHLNSEVYNFHSTTKQLTEWKSKLSKYAVQLQTTFSVTGSSFSIHDLWFLQDVFVFIKHK